MTTYVLVHGAWHSGEVWTRVVPLLQEAGHRAYAPSLTGHGDRAQLLSPDVNLGTHVDDVLRVIADEELTDVVLVGHSYAGMVVSAVAHRVPERIADLVFLDAMVPADGESVLDVMPVTRAMIDRAAPGWRVPPMPGDFGVSDPADVAWLRTMLSDEAVGCYTQPVALDNPAADRIPRTHIHCVGRPGPERRPVPPAETVWELPTGHDCMVTMPAELTDLLLKLA
ncbi:alpha/beta fold hydrolase [Actinoplanes sp. N902-109]|uniref:alpha/beta fold hydrolase n=1 Tax=Actinoplanes sp. (strain N902-109) TaxID=649831 RepID=UPI0003296069|nr:alpha/beta fold hydrolase [Actinoplanes sp. N902-109]AGL13826.1 esterase [Actinoplanes sp. N902-109]